MSASIAIRKYGYITFVIIMALAGSFGVYKFGNKLFVVKNFEVIGTGIRIEVNQNRLPKNLLFFPGDKLRQQILHDNPLIADVTFEKRFPHTLIIVVIPRTAVAVIRTPGGIMGLDRNGILLGEPNQTNTLPELKFDLPRTMTGEKISDQKIIQSLAFIGLTQTFLPLTSIEASGSASLLARAKKTDIIIAQNANLTNTATTLQTLLAGFRIKGNLPASIDLRFDKPVVKF